MSRQCPGTTIERNFEVGTSLSVSLVVNGSIALVPLCEDSPFASPLLDYRGAASAASTSSCHHVSTSAAATDGSAGDAAPLDRRLHATGDDKGRSPSSFPFSFPFTRRRNRSRGDRLLQEQGDSSDTTLDDETTGGRGWAWETDGPTFGLGERSRMRLSSHVFMLDNDDDDDNDDQDGGAWTPLLNTSSAAALAVKEAVRDNEEEEEGGGSQRAGVITASLKRFDFEQEAVFSTLLFFSKVEPVEESSGRGDERLSELLEFHSLSTRKTATKSTWRGRGWRSERLGWARRACSERSEQWGQGGVH